MNTQNPSTGAAQAVGTAEAKDVVLPRLMRVSEVERDCAPDSAPAQLVKWLREFVARPNPQLGRPGTVCPFVPHSLDLDTIWISEITDTQPDVENICAVMAALRNVFLETEPTSGQETMNKAILITMPGLAALGEEGLAMIDTAENKLKPYFVDKGMMIGGFYAFHPNPGLRNPDFRPFQSPVPLLGIRRMAEADLPFMKFPSYTPQETSTYLRAYLFRLGGSLRLSKFNEALAGLIAAEVAMQAANANSDKASV